MNKTVYLISTFLALLSTNSARASPVLIDFTSDMWSGVDGRTSYTRSYGGLDVTLNATGGAMTFNARSGGDSAGSLALHGDGIGIGDDEIGFLGGQRLDVTFSSNVRVLGYYFLDFFADEGFDGLTGEFATVMFDSALWFDEGFARDDLGYYAREGLSIATTQLSFMAGLGGDLDALSQSDLTSLGLFDPLSPFFGFSDYSLAGILIDFGRSSIPVPAPSSLALLAVGLAGLSAARRPGVFL